MSEEKTNKAKIIVLSVILAVVVVFIIVFAIIQIVRIEKENAPEKPSNEQEVVVQPEQEETTNPIVFTTSYNDAISRHILTDDGYAYTGTYKFDSCGKIIFNYKTETNKNGFSVDEVTRFFRENGCENLNEYRTKLIQEKNQLLGDSTLEIDDPIDPNTGTNFDYGVFKNTLSSEFITGIVYGDLNLAVMIKDDTNGQEFQFMSLNYKELSDALSVPSVTTAENGKLYVFENVYRDGRLLYSLTYVYAKV